MADVVDISKKRKKSKRRIISVCWGGFGTMERSVHVVSSQKGCTIDEDSGLLILDEGEGTLVCYPLGGVFYWSEADHPEDGDIA